MRLCSALTSVCVMGLCTVGATAADETFPLVDGDRQAVIVGDDIIKSGPTLGSYPGPPHFLQHYVEQCTGRRIEVVAEDKYDPAAMPYAVFVGRSRKGQEVLGERLKALDRDGYIVHVTPRFAVLIGAAEHSTAWAQFDFAREVLGVDVYFPAKCGLIVPKRPRALAPVGTRVEQPVFLSRAFSALNTWRNARGNPDIPWRMYRRFQFHHNIHTFITVEEFGKTHPECFPWRDGKRVIVSSAAGPGPCISNPDVVRIATEKCRKWFDEKPEEVTVSLGMTDGGWCECPQCQAMDGPDIFGNARSRSRRYYTFLNQVARGLRETHPGRYIGVLGYAGAEAPPEGIEVERNIIPYLCYTRANWAHPDVKAADLKNTGAWLERLDRIGIYEYLYGSGFSVPQLHLHHLAEFLRTVGHRAPDSGFYAEIYSNHGLDGPKAWVVEKLLWNPFQDVDALVRRWCEACFEEAAPAMERYFRGLEDAWNRGNLKLGPFPGKFPFMGNDRQLELFPPEEVKPRLADLDEARRLAKTPETRERIEYFASTFRITELTTLQYHAYRKAQQAAADGAPARDLLAALIGGDRAAPREDARAYTERLQAEDPSKFMGGVEVKAATELARRVALDLAWPEAHKRLKAGERDAGVIAAAARAAIEAQAPADATADPAGKARMDGLAQMASRIAVARRAAQPPVIDGRPDEAIWEWNDHYPWFAWKSGVQAAPHTLFAFAYDDEFLYLAVRCPQDDVAKRQRCKGYGAPAWKYASVEFFISPDARDAPLADPVRPKDEPPDHVRTYQVIVALGGGIYEREQRATEQNCAVTDDASEWRAELKMEWKRLGYSPKQFPYLRINLVRNLTEGGHSGVAWFPSTGAHAALEARGWLILR